MELLTFFTWFNGTILALPTTLLFFGVSIFFTLQSRFIQIRAFGRFFQMIKNGIKHKAVVDKNHNPQTISGFRALFTAMATSIGTGSIVAPSLAIIAGGPAALFWLVLYLFFASVTKFVEVTFAMHTRQLSGPEQKLVGGPMQYLSVLHPFLARWYGGIMLTLYFFGWQTVQSNTLATLYAQESVPQWLVGLVLAILVYFILRGGAKRVGLLASKLVPAMFVLYVGFALYILLSDITMLKQAIQSIFVAVLNPSSCMIGLCAGSLLQAVRAGVYSGIFISEAGLGTSSIAHAMADTKNERDQGILAMYSTLADVILSVISGLLILVAKIEIIQHMRPTLIYDVFKMHASVAGTIVLLVSISLFVLTTLMGNAFNGMQIFATFTKFRAVGYYNIAVCVVIFIGALMPVPLVWEIMNTLLAFAAIPNLLGLFILSLKKPEMLKY